MNGFLSVCKVEAKLVEAPEMNRSRPRYLNIVLFKYNISKLLVLRLGE